jgi:DNA-binding response OmpR family regulator
MMTNTNLISDEQDEYREAFLRHLPKRIETIAQRIIFYRRDGWEASGLALLADDVRRLIDACARYDQSEPREYLRTLGQMLGEHMASKTLPDTQQSQSMLDLTAVLAESAFSSSASAPRAARIDPVPPVPTAPAPVEVVKAAATTASPGAKPAWAAQDQVDRAAPAIVGTVRDLYHLSDGNPLANELAQGLRANDYEIETVETVDELSELLLCMSPQVLLVDASRMADLIDVGTARRDAQKRTQHRQRIQMVAMAAKDDLPSRLVAHRAGVDVLLFPPFEANEVLRQLEAMLSPAAEETIRVLIVEDDRAQALFAQSVLTNAGMQAQVEADPMHLLETLKSLHPDLVLMDLHMPDANGVELTALIREHPAFTRTPIVFLSGESDPEARFAAINAGGDDFLTKPIRPKHLIDTVKNRVRRVRSIGRQESGSDADAIQPGM